MKPTWQSKFIQKGDWAEDARLAGAKGSKRHLELQKHIGSLLEGKEARVWEGLVLG